MVLPSRSDSSTTEQLNAPGATCVPAEQSNLARSNGYGAASETGDDGASVVINAVSVSLKTMSPL